MAWDHELASAIKKQPRVAQPYYIGTVVHTSPLTLSLLGGEILAPPVPVLQTATAAAQTWVAGDQAACLLGASLLVLDKVQG